MPCYPYQCNHCDNEFEHFSPVDMRDYAVCPYCGCGADRVFVPATVLIPARFEFQRSDFAQTYEQAQRQDLDNEEYLRTKPKESPKKGLGKLYNEERIKRNQPPVPV